MLAILRRKLSILLVSLLAVAIGDLSGWLLVDHHPHDQLGMLILIALIMVLPIPPIARRLRPTASDRPRISDLIPGLVLGFIGFFATGSPWWGGLFGAGSAVALMALAVYLLYQVERSQPPASALTPPDDRDYDAG